MTSAVSSNMVKIAKGKSVLKEYSSNGRCVYLNDGDEFQLELFNPTSDILGCRIRINSSWMENILVIRPGERIWLERYLDKDSRFKFNTYNIEDSPAAKTASADNGKITVSFYREKKPQTYRTVYPLYEGWGNSITYTTPEWKADFSSNNSINVSAAGQDDTYYPPQFVFNSVENASASLGEQDTVVPQSAAYAVQDSYIETGRIEYGNRSGQSFTTEYGLQFDDFPSMTETITILPMSRKPFYKNDAEKRYCTQCGKKLSPKFRYCPVCGTKAD